MDPVNQRSASDWLPHTMLFDGLLNLGPQGTYPALATDWVTHPGGLRMDFNLRRGVKFHNGDDFTAEDVKFTFERIVAEGGVHNRRATYLTALERVEILEPHKVRFHFKRPWADFLVSLRSGGTQQIVPKGYYEKAGPKGFNDKPVGTGPFKFAESRRGEYIRYEANTAYWDRVANVRTVTTRLVVEPFTRTAMLERGEADIIMDITGPLLDKVRSNRNLALVFAKDSGTSVFVCNRRDVALCNDRRFRMALAYAIDREVIAKKILGDTCRSATQHMTPSSFGYEPSIAPIPYDPTRARALLAEAGVKDGMELTLAVHTQSFGSLPNGPGVLEAIAGYLEAVGLKIQRVPVDTAAWLGLMRSGTQKALFYGPSSGPDDGGSLIETWYSSRAWCKAPCTVNVPEYEKVADATNAETDAAKRAQIIRDWAKLERERMEMLPLFWCSTPFAHNRKVKDWKPGIGSPYHLNLQSIVLTP